MNEQTQGTAPSDRPDPLTPDQIAWLRRIAAAALNTWVGRNWPTMEAMRRDGIGHGLVEKSGQPDRAIRRYLTTFEPDLVVDLLDALAARSTVNDADTPDPDFCGWDTRRGDGPIGGPCRLSPGHVGPHDHAAPLCRRRSGDANAEECGLPRGHDGPHSPWALVSSPIPSGSDPRDATIERLTRALRVATHSPHDQDGEPNPESGFPVCSVCGAIQTSIPSGSDLTAALDALPRGGDRYCSYPYHVSLPDVKAALSASSASSPGLDAERLAEAIDEAGTVTWDDDPRVTRPKRPTELARDVAPIYARLSPSPSTGEPE